jgi:hypothetical protein
MPVTIPVEELTPEVARVCGPAAPPPLKLMAARGLMPIGTPADLVTALTVLGNDAADAVRAAAHETLAGLPAEVLAAVYGGDVHPAVLDDGAERFGSRDEILVPILRNPLTPDDAVVRVARTARENALEVIAVNETRLLRCPAVIETLYLNRNTRMSTVDRVIEFAVRNRLELTNIPAYREIAASIEGALISEPDDEPTPDDTLFSSVMSYEGAALTGGGGGFADFGDEDGLGLGDDMFSDFDGDGAPKKKEEPTDEREKLSFDISKLTVSQKIRIALLGNAAHRALLLRDSNKLVSLAAIKSPAVTDQEVGVISQSRSVSEDVIRFIADNRDWTKNYLVKCNLVNNPKTPIGQALRFLPHLRPGDLKSLTGNKNIPQAVANAARQLLQRKQSGSGGGGNR